MRFKTYTYDWFKYCCSDFLKAYSTNSLSWDKLSYADSEGVLNLHYGLIHNGAPTLIDTSSYNLPKIIEAVPKSYELCKNGDVIFADASEDTNDICKPVEICETNGKPIVSGLHTIHTRDYKNLTCVGFKGYLFSSKPFHKQVFRLTQGTKIFSINFNNFREMSVSIPQKEEQLKIVEFLTKIDDRISTQSKIIDKLKSQMNCIIDNIVDYSSPQFQFKDLYITAGEGGTPSTVNSSYYENGNIPFIKIEDLSNKYLKANKDFITEQGLKNSSAWIIPANSIIYSNGATIGRISINTYPICTKQGILGIIPSKIVLTEYLYYFIRSIYFRKQVHRITVKGTMDCAYLKDLNLIKCYIPALEQQEKIIKSLRCLDEKILLEEMILIKLKEQKKFLLSNMFI